MYVRGTSIFEGGSTRGNMPKLADLRPSYEHSDNTTHDVADQPPSHKTLDRLTIDYHQFGLYPYRLENDTNLTLDWLNSDFPNPSMTPLRRRAALLPNYSDPFLLTSTHNLTPNPDPLTYNIKSPSRNHPFNHHTLNPCVPCDDAKSPPH